MATVAAPATHGYTRDMADTAYQLRVTMRGIRPPNAVLQGAFGWTNSHLHQFRVGGDSFGVPDPDGWGADVIDERRVHLHDVAGVKSRFVYEYDSGDGWEHDVVVERVDSASEAALPSCVDGRRSRPPEDCGGPHGYANLLEALADPSHPEHAEMGAWIDPSFAPEEFELETVNKQLRTLGLRWQRAVSRKARPRPKARSAND